MIIPSAMRCVCVWFSEFYLLLFTIPVNNNTNTNVSLLNFAIAITKCIRGFTCGVCECAF